MRGDKRGRWKYGKVGIREANKPLPQGGGDAENMKNAK